MYNGNLSANRPQISSNPDTILTSNSKDIVLCWIPGYVNIPGNDKANSAAKSALSLPITDLKLPATELIP